MKKVIELLEHELERQTLLHMSNKMEKQKHKDFPGYKGPPLYTESHLFREELEDAITFLKIKPSLKMNSKLHYVLQIEISDIVVDAKYYSFKYYVILNGQAHKTAEYSAKHSRQEDIADFERTLHDGYALELVCQGLQLSY